jgi:hypothetical protein
MEAKVLQPVLGAFDAGVQVWKTCVLSVPLLLRVLSDTRVTSTAPARFDTASSINSDIVFLTKLSSICLGGLNGHFFESDN